MAFRLAFVACPAALLLAACTATIDSGQAFKTSADKAEDIVKNLLSQRDATRAEVAYSSSSYEYLMGRTHPKCEPIGGTKTDLAREVRLSADREAKLALLKDYLDRVDAFLSPSAAEQTVVSLLEAASSLSGVAGIVPAPAAVGVTASALKGIVSDVGRRGRAAALQRLARDMDPTIQKVISDLERNVKPVNQDLEAALNLWEVCEHAKLEKIRLHDHDSTLIEKEARYRLFHDTRFKLKQAVRGVIEAERAFQKIAELHQKLADPAFDPQQVAAEAKASADSVVAGVVAARGALQAWEERDRARRTVPPT